MNKHILSVYPIFLLSILYMPGNCFSQNVGIGTATPLFKLDVKNGSINTDSLYRISSFPVLSITGIGNLFIGQQAGQINTGAANTFAGFFSGNANTTGIGNSCFGNLSGRSNITGNYNSMFGTAAGYSTTTGYGNSFVGGLAGYFNSTGTGNSFFGDSSGYNNTNGAENTYAGHKAGFTNSTGDLNVLFGSKSGFYNTGNLNSFFGYQAGLSNTSGSDNCFIGFSAGYNNITGSYNTMLGGATNTTLPNLSFATAVGAGAKVGCSNCLILGGLVANDEQTRVGINNTTPLTDLHIVQQTDASGDKVRGIRIQRLVNTNHWRTLIDPSNNYVFEFNDALYSYIEPVSATYVSSSDERLKKNIFSLPNLLDKILLLQPKTYQYIATADAGRYSYGFLAQDVEKLFPEFVFTSENGTKGIAYSNFGVIAIKAIQEQQEIIKALQIEIKSAKAEMPAQIEKQQQLIETLLKKNEALEKRIETLEKK